MGKRIEGKRKEDSRTKEDRRHSEWQVTIKSVVLVILTLDGEKFK